MSEPWRFGGKILGEQHSETASSYGSLAIEVEPLGDYAAAIHYADRALAIRRKISGEDDPETANCLIRLGDLSFATGEFTAARGYFERALAIRRKSKGESDPDTAAAYGRVGNTDVMLGDFPAGRRNVERALAIQIKARGEEDPQTASFYCSLANLCSRSGDYAAAARTLNVRWPFRGSLAGTKVWRCDRIRGARYGLPCVPRLSSGPAKHRARPRDRPEDLRRGSLPQCRDSQQPGPCVARPGRLRRGPKNYELALAIDRRILGEDHQSTAIVHSNLGLLCFDQGDFAAAFAEEEQALAITRNFLSRMFVCSPKTSSSPCRTTCGLLWTTI